MIGDKDLSVTAKMLDFCALQHKLIAHNIANAEVPGFRRLEADFQSEMLKAMEKGDIAPEAPRTRFAGSSRRPFRTGANGKASCVRRDRDSSIFND